MPSLTTRTINRLGVTALALALLAAASWAQQKPALAASPAAQSGQFSDQELRSFAKAAVQLHRIGEKTRASLESTKTVDEKQAIAKDLAKQQVQAVKASGLTVRRYNAIANAARVNPKLRAKVNQLLKEYAPRGVVVVAASVPMTFRRR